MKKGWCIIYIMHYHLAIKRNKILPFAERQMDLENVKQYEISHNEKNEYHILSLVCGIQKNDKDELNCKVESQMQRTNLRLPRGEGRGGITWEIGIYIYRLLYIRQPIRQDWKREVFILIPKKGNAKECSNYCTIALISYTSKVMSKFSKTGFNSMWTVNFPMFKLDLEKAEEPKIKLPTSLGGSEIKRVPEKYLLLLY